MQDLPPAALIRSPTYRARTVALPFLDRAIPLDEPFHLHVFLPRRVFHSQLMSPIIRSAKTILNLNLCLASLPSSTRLLSNVDAPPYLYRVVPPVRPKSLVCSQYGTGAVIIEIRFLMGAAIGHELEGREQVLPVGAGIVPDIDFLGCALAVGPCVGEDIIGGGQRSDEGSESH
jgi:hypothetical protein